MRTSPGKRRVLCVAGLALVGLALAACGGSASTPATAKGTASAPSAAASSGASTAPPGSQRPVPVENNPPGDIPDNTAYVPYANPAGRYTFVHPEGWARVVHANAVTFTDKLNGITATTRTAAGAPTTASANAEVAALRRSQPAFELRSVKAVTLPGGSGVLVVYRRNSAPDPVTGKMFRDEVNRYEIYRGGREVVLELYGAVGSDNVDPYTKISQSLRLA